AIARLPYADCVNLSAMPGIHVLRRLREKEDVDSRNEPGQDDFTNFGAAGGALSRQRRLGLFGNRLERYRFVDGEVRQHLAIHRDTRLGKAVDKPAVGHSERPHRGIEALDPQRAEGALLALAVAEGVLPGLVDRGLGGSDGVLAATVKAFGGLVDFLVLGVRGHTAFNA